MISLKKLVFLTRGEGKFYIVVTDDDVLYPYEGTFGNYILRCKDESLVNSIRMAFLVDAKVVEVSEELFNQIKHVFEKLPNEIKEKFKRSKPYKKRYEYFEVDVKVLKVKVKDGKGYIVLDFERKKDGIKSFGEAILIQSCKVIRARKLFKMWLQKYANNKVIENCIFCTSDWIYFKVVTRIPELFTIEDESETEEISLKEALAGWVDSSITAVIDKEIEKEIHEKTTEESLERLARVEKELKRDYISVRIVAFNLPSEYRGATRTLNVKMLREEITFKVDPTTIRKLRVKFYTLLNTVSYKTELGWILFSNVEDSKLKALNEHINELNKIFSTTSKIYVLDVILPRKYLVEKITENIVRKKARVKELEERLNMLSTKKKHMINNIKSQIRRTIKYIKMLEEELKYIQC